MAKKYLSLEEAAQIAGMSVSQLKQLRERGEIRGFSDGGTWKFKADDIEELVRSRQADSNPDVPLLTDEELDADSSIIGMEEEDLVSEQPTVIRGASALDDDEEDGFMVGMSSDSDVQLIPNELLTDDGGGTEDMVSLGDSDSDVRLADSSPALTHAGSDSDVKLVGGSDSDVQIVGGSDSDVQIIDDKSDSDVKLVDDAKTEEHIPIMEDDSDSDVALVPPAGSGVSLDMGDTDGSVFDDDESNISLGDGSSITLAAESGISLEKIDSDKDLAPGEDSGLDLVDDSDLSLSTDDSGIALEGFDDSGIALELDDDDDNIFDLDDDSGIELTPADSGIALESIPDSGIALDEEDVTQRTMPMMPQSAGLEDQDDTAMDMPTLEDDSEFELGAASDHDTDDGNVIMFDDDDEIDEEEATIVKKRGEVSEEYDMTAEADDFDLGEDDFDEFAEAGAFEEDDDAFDDGEYEDDDLAVDDVVGEDDELDDLDVFGDEGDDFDDDFDAGTSSPEFSVPGSRAVAVPEPQREWGVGPFIGLLLSTALMAVCGMMMFDLVRSMWSWNDPSSFNSPLLGFVKDMIKK